MGFRKRKRIIEEEIDQDEIHENPFEDAPNVPELQRPHFSWENLREKMEFNLIKQKFQNRTEIKF